MRWYQYEDLRLDVSTMIAKLDSTKSGSLEHAILLYQLDSIVSTYLADAVADLEKTDDAPLRQAGDAND